MSLATALGSVSADANGNVSGSGFCLALYQAWITAAAALNVDLTQAKHKNNRRYCAAFADALGQAVYNFCVEAQLRVPADSFDGSIPAAETVLAPGVIE